MSFGTITIIFGVLACGECLILVAVFWLYKVLSCVTKMFSPYLWKNRHPSGILNVQPLGTEARRITLGDPGLDFYLHSCVYAGVLSSSSVASKCCCLSVLLANSRVQLQCCQNVNTQGRSLVQLIISVLSISVYFGKGVIFVTAVTIVLVQLNNAGQCLLLESSMLVACSALKMSGRLCPYCPQRQRSYCLVMCNHLLMQSPCSCFGLKGTWERGLLRMSCCPQAGLVLSASWVPPGCDQRAPERVLFG